MHHTSSSVRDGLGRSELPLCLALTIVIAFSILLTAIYV